MTDAQALLSAFKEEWEAGLRPDVEAFLAAASADQQASSRTRSRRSSATRRCRATTRSTLERTGVEPTRA